MTTKIHVCLINNESETLELVYQLKDLPVAKRWVATLDHNLNKPDKCTIHDRFVGFGRTISLVSNEIRQAIQIIEAYKPGSISLDLNEDFTQDSLNQLHRHFEDLMGSVENISPFYIQAPPHVKRAIADINIKGHELESLNNNNDYKQIYVELLNIDRELLEPQDSKHFSLKLEFGDMFLHYAQLGKQLLDVYRDKDVHVSAENIRPLKYISGEFDLQFTDDQDMEQYSHFFSWLRKNKIDPEDPSLQLGWLVIGKMDLTLKPFAGLSHKEITTLISQFPKVTSISISK